MIGADLTESVVEQATLAWFEGLGYAVASGPQITGAGPDAERSDHRQVVLARRLRDALGRLNPDVPGDALDEAASKLTRAEFAQLIQNNRRFHHLLIDGVEVEHRHEDGSIRSAPVRVLDFGDPANNDWLVVNQLTVLEGQHTRRPDVVVFVNGLPLAVFELKDASDPQATIWDAFNQLQTYKAQIPSLLAHNEVLVISDGVQARLGSLTAERERFMPWRTVDGEELEPPTAPQLSVLIEGVFQQRRFLDFVRHFVVFESDGAQVEKKIAAYHQFHAVNRALEETVRASRSDGDKRVGVVWHTQGSGKSLTMVFYAGRVVLHPAMENPTLVVLTDRNDLDDQLFGTFSRSSAVLRQVPVQAADRADLREKLRVPAGGVVFTTIQKFFPQEGEDAHPLLSERRNVVVIADEAHRSQYGFIGGFAQRVREALPGASFIGFTGTPVETDDANTRAVFGEYISVYDIEQAVEDGATVPIFYEGRLAKLELDEAERPRLDEEFEEATEGEEVARKERLTSKWAQLEAIVGADRRVELVAKDLVEHFAQRQEAMEGKALVVCMSRRICALMYEALVRLRPDWHSDDDAQGALKVVITGSSDDEAQLQPHIRSKARREVLAQRFKNPDDPLRVVIVRDMWLTGFDVPPLHTMYVDKPMHGHSLMQAIARVNRVFRDKPGGLIVDYLGLADRLRLALADYTRARGKGSPTISQAEAVAVMQEKYEVAEALFHGFDFGPFKTGAPTERLGVLAAAMEHVLQQEDGKNRLLKGSRSSHGRSSWRCRTRTPWRSATTWCSSRRCALNS